MYVKHWGDGRGSHWHDRTRPYKAVRSVHIQTGETSTAVTRSYPSNLWEEKGLWLIRPLEDKRGAALQAGTAGKARASLSKILDAPSMWEH